MRRNFRDPAPDGYPALRTAFVRKHPSTGRPEHLVAASHSDPAGAAPVWPGDAGPMPGRSASAARPVDHRAGAGAPHGAL